MPSEDLEKLQKGKENEGDINVQIEFEEKKPFYASLSHMISSS